MLEIKPWFRAAGDRLGELQEHESSSPCSHGLAEEWQISSSPIRMATLTLVISLLSLNQLRGRTAESASMFILHGLKQVCSLEVEALAGDFGCSLAGVILGEQGFDLALSSTAARRIPRPRGSPSRGAGLGKFYYGPIRPFQLPSPDRGVDLVNAGLTRSGGSRCICKPLVIRIAGLQDALVSVRASLAMSPLDRPVEQ